MPIILIIFTILKSWTVMLPTLESLMSNIVTGENKCYIYLLKFNYNCLSLKINSY